MASEDKHHPNGIRNRWVADQAVLTQDFGVPRKFFLTSPDELKIATKNRSRHLEVV